MEDNGYLIIQVFAANRGLPIEGAVVTVSDSEGNPIRILKTDRSGNTEKIQLAAPDRRNSGTPSDLQCYSEYNIKTQKDGYYPVEDEFVPIFGGQVTIQPVALIPLPFGTYPTEEIIKDTEPNL